MWAGHRGLPSVRCDAGVVKPRPGRKSEVLAPRLCWRAALPPRRHLGPPAVCELKPHCGTLAALAITMARSHGAPRPSAPPSPSTTVNPPAAVSHRLPRGDGRCATWPYGRPHRRCISNQDISRSQHRSPARAAPVTGREKPQASLRPGHSATLVYEQTDSGGLKTGPAAGHASPDIAMALTQFRPVHDSWPGSRSSPLRRLRFFRRRSAAFRGVVPVQARRHGDLLRL